MELINILILVIGIPVLIIYYVFVINIAQSLYEKWKDRKQERQSRRPSPGSEEAIGRMYGRAVGNNHSK